MRRCASASTCSCRRPSRGRRQPEQDPRAASREPSEAGQRHRRRRSPHPRRTERVIAALATPLVHPRHWRMPNHRAYCHRGVQRAADGSLGARRARERTSVRASISFPAVPEREEEERHARTGLIAAADRGGRGDDERRGRPEPADADCGHVEILAARRALEAGTGGSAAPFKNADARCRCASARQYRRRKARRRIRHPDG
jgi:hypothetical protein